MNPGHVKACHDPRRDLCPQNAHVMLDCNCTSGKVVVRKPFKTVRVTDPQADRAHDIVAEIHMGNGMLVLRQKGRRKRVSVTLGTLYERLVFNEAMRSVRAHKAARKGKKRRADRSLENCRKSVSSRSVPAELAGAAGS